MAGLIQKLIHYIRVHKNTMNLEQDEIAEIIKTFKTFALEDHLPRSLDLTEGDGTPGIVEVYGDLFTRINNLEMVLKAGPERESWITSKLDSVLEGMGYDLESEVDKDLPQYRELCRQVLKATIDHLEKGREELETSYSELELDRPYRKRWQKEGVSEKCPTESVSLQTILDEYWKKKQSKWGGASHESYDRYTRRLLAHFGGETPIDSIDYKAMEQFRDELNATGNKGKPIAEKTVNLHLEFYSGVFNHAIQSGRISHNPVSGVKFADTRDQQKLNDPFPRKDLERLFHSKEYTQDSFKKGWMFWLPVLLLYTGARVEELCQLYIDDINKVDGHWVFDIDATRPDQSVKTHEKRYLPLHPFITDDLNFIEYVDSLPDQTGRVFPELPLIVTKPKRPGAKERKRYGHKPSTNWFPAYKKRSGVVAEKGKKTIHSFRHNVSACLMENDVQDYVIAMVLGHKHQQISTGRYGKKFDPKLLMEKAILKLDYGIDLTHLKESKYVPK
jgi:integrase